MPRLQTLLADLVAMPSVSAPSFDKAGVRATAEALLAILADAGFENTRLLEVDGGNPAVFAEIPAPPGAPTILLYAHYDVQPPGPASEWATGPYDPVVEDGRLYGRGSADDKAGVVMHLGAVAAHGGHPPVGVKLFFEGEEEAGSESLGAILENHGDLLRPDIIVIGDGGMWSEEIPAFLTSLRGLVACNIEIRTLAAAVHSGEFGGVYPDALTAMTRLLSTLHDDHGDVAVPGLFVGEEPVIEVSTERAQKTIRPADGLQQIGTGSISARMWARPSISVLALDAPSVAEAINQLVPVCRAKVSMRIPPGQDAAAAMAALKAHLEANAPWGTTLTFLHEELGQPSTMDVDNEAVDAWRQGYREAFGVEPVEMGAGGTIPFIATFAEKFPGCPLLVIGCSDPTSSYHAPNESVSLSAVEGSVLAEAIAFRLLGSG